MHIVKNVWLRTGDPIIFESPAYNFVGDLMFEKNTIKFKCHNFAVEIDASNARVRNFWYGFLGKWIQVGSSCGSPIYICNGEWSGWSSIFGGNKSILSKIQNYQL